MTGKSQFSENDEQVPVFRDQETRQLEAVVNTGTFPISDPAFARTCKEELSQNGILVLQDFLQPNALSVILQEALEKKDKAYYCSQSHTVFLKREQDAALPPEHPANKLLASSKGCITDDQVSTSSPLRSLYDNQYFRNFLCAVLGEAAIFPYADKLSSINVHYAQEGQELAWHFDNSSFATTLLIQKAEGGGQFEYCRGIGPSDTSSADFTKISELIDGTAEPASVNLDAGALVLFRGRTALHRVTPVVGSQTRILSVLAYNSEPDIALSKQARLTFYGRE